MAVQKSRVSPSRRGMRRAHGAAVGVSAFCAVLFGLPRPVALWWQVSKELPA